SLGFAASFLKPTSTAFALAVCAWVLAGHAGGDRSSGPWRLLVDGSYAVYLVHGGVILAMAGWGAPGWQNLLGTPAGPLLLGLAGTAIPLAAWCAASRWLPAPARRALFG
ncbi:MAG TPA: hypothetical protein VFT43_15360, partial [Candidatus Polarisedimenticolia bacterium]|nr:hypothetical protein [Candidatus Polarisedimenticolia bacterium]